VLKPIPDNSFRGLYDINILEKTVLLIKRMILSRNSESKNPQKTKCGKEET